jgi:hypothetical protein
VKPVKVIGLVIGIEEQQHAKRDHGQREQQVIEGVQG